MVRALPDHSSKMLAQYDRRLFNAELTKIVAAIAARAWAALQ